MSPPKPTIVLISGAWHTPSSYSHLTTALRAQGYEVHVPRLPSTNAARPPTADLTTDTALIRTLAEELTSAGKKVVAIMHSYGGQVGTNALHGLSVSTLGLTNGGGVTHLIYLCASALTEGNSMISMVKQFNHEALVPLAFDFADDKTCVSRDPKTLLVGSGTGSQTGDLRDENEVEQFLSTLVRWNGEAMYQEIEKCAWRTTPSVSYIYTEGDMTIPLDYQKEMVRGMEKEGVEVQTFALGTGHCPGFTATEGVVDAVNRVIGVPN
jgi:pimeloyl-ACP methyl ester carboxylesterase